MAERKRGTGEGLGGLSGHVSNDSVRAGPFQAVTVNLFDLSLCKSLRRLKASLLDCGGWGEGGRFPLCLLDDDDNQVCFWPSCCEAIISSLLLSSHLLFCVLLLKAKAEWESHCAEVIC